MCYLKIYTKNVNLKNYNHDFRNLKTPDKLN